MERVQVIEVNGKKIVIADYSNLNIKFKQECYDALKRVHEVIKEQGDKQALIITDLSNTNFDKEISNTFKGYVKSNSPFIKASALVGISGMQKVLLSTIKILTKRDFYLAANMDDAKRWLLQQ